MSARPRLLVLATAASLLALVLVLTCLQAVSALVAVPTSWWGPSQLSAALVALASAAGAAGAAWHALSALLALLVLPARGRRRAAAPAQRLLARWGAPWVRRILVGTLSLSAVTAPALAAVPTPDDLGWRPTQSAPAPQAADDVATGDPAAGDPPTGPAPEDTAGPSPADPAAPGTAPGGAAPPGGVPSGTVTSAPTAPGPQGAPPGAPGAPGYPGASGAPGAQGSPAPGAEEEATASAPAGTGASHGTRATGSHTVRPGESLWSITADLLHTTDRGAIASAWPTLWAANRVVVGRDPGLIRPGTVLQVPEALLPA
ncbi:LysM peptidoglycan-binding domain-containing protein [uncultured Actinomyces sp.]|uniref:LysM peptidoglycan-binding domain-containing protein n=1 Tax=uncultured Actinomyces sp. TaxID=249061 RepID=UPI0028DC7824|nr:LysM peptidoglycan-binding domain-containing protein [uncultured Actinomyces sp.]